MDLSTAAQNAKPSGVRRMFELAKQYDDAINLTLGEPGFTAPDHIIQAAIKGLADAQRRLLCVPQYCRLWDVIKASC